MQNQTGMLQRTFILYLLRALRITEVFFYFQSLNLINTKLLQHKEVANLRIMMKLFARYENFIR